MRHCNERGRPPAEETARHLRDAGEDPGDLPAHELEVAVCELEVHHEGAHADHLCEVDRATQLWVRWLGNGYTFVRLTPCLVPMDSGHAVCDLFTNHAPGHSWQLDDLLHG